MLLAPATEVNATHLHHGSSNLYSQLRPKSRRGARVRLRPTVLVSICFRRRLRSVCIISDHIRVCREGHHFGMLDEAEDIMAVIGENLDASLCATFVSYISPSADTPLERPPLSDTILNP